MACIEVISQPSPGASVARVGEAQIAHLAVRRCARLSLRAAIEDLLRRFHAQMDERGLKQPERRRAEDRIFEELRDARARVVQPGKTGRRPAASRAGSKRRKHSGPR